MNLTQLAGNTPLKRQLDLQCARRGLSHAYILSGPAGIGKRTLGTLLAAALVCTSDGEIPCLCCSGCKKALSGIHPDILRVGDDGKDIPVAQIRALRADAYIRPNEAQRKVYMIVNAQGMSQSAQNAMLKLLEEGPAYAAFLLLTEHAAALLPTIRSRCETLSLTPLTRGEAAAWLSTRFPDMPAQTIQTAAATCEGLLGRAVPMLEGGTPDSQVTDTAVAIVSALSSGDELRLLGSCAALERWDRDKFTALLDELLVLLRDGLVCAVATQKEPDPRRRAAAEAVAAARSTKALLHAMGELESLRSAAGYNVGTGHLAGWLCASLSSVNP